MVIKKPVLGQSAGDLFPHLIAEFHPTKNERDSLFDYAYASNSKINWVCSVCSYEWVAPLANRTRLGSGCFECSKEKRASSQR